VKLRPYRKKTRPSIQKQESYNLVRINIVSIYWDKEQGSSVSIVPDYGLDDRAIEVRSPVGAKDFSSSLCVQAGSEDHTASCTFGTGVLSRG
jgi:hypothetical protein